MNGWRTIRVFISSTFQDMHSERDYLIKFVFPKLREEFIKYRINLLDIDLRWGITKEEAENHRILDILFKEIDKCDYFIGIIGNRYGSIVETIPEDIVNKYETIRKFNSESITHLEVLYCINEKHLNKINTFFYFRNLSKVINQIPEEPLNNIFSEKNPRHEKLNVLTENIKSQFNYFDYFPTSFLLNTSEHKTEFYGKLLGLEIFGDQVFKDLSNAFYANEGINAEEKGTGDEKKINREQLQEIFLQSKLSLFVGREEFQKALLSYVEGLPNKPLLIFGKTGSGKSSLLSWLVARLRNDDFKDYQSYAYFAGIDKDSGNFQKTLIEVSQRLAAAMNHQFETPKTFEGLITSFKFLLSQAQFPQKYIIIFDGIDQFDKYNYLKELGWLPDILPTNLKIIIGVVVNVENNCTILRRSEDLSYLKLEVSNLTINEKKTYLRKLSELSSKRLDDDQTELLFQNPCIENPLYFYIAFEELRCFGRYECLTERIRLLPKPNSNNYDIDDFISALYSQVITRLSNDFGAELVKEVLTLISCTRIGVSETILKKLVSKCPHVENFYPLLRQLRPFLINRGELLDFFHNGFRDTIKNHYLKNDTEKKRQHLKLSAEFIGLGDELMWQLSQAGEWTKLSNLLSSIYFFGSNWATNAEDLKNSWRQIEKNTKITIGKAYEQVINMSIDEATQFVNRDNLFFINLEFLSIFLDQSGYHKEALKVQKLLTNFYEKAHHPGYIVALLNQSIIYLSKNELDNAEELLNKAEQVALIGSNNKYLAAAYNLKAEIRKKQGQVNEAINCLNYSEQLARKFELKSELINSLKQQSEINSENGDYEIAMIKENEIVSFSREIGDMCAIANSYEQQASIYFRKREYKTAISRYENALEIWDNEKQYEHKAECLCKHAIALIEMEDYSKALLSFFDEEDICKETGFEERLVNCLINQGNVFHERHEYNRALEKFREAEKICFKRNSKYKLQICKSNIASALSSLGKYEDALVMFTELEEINKEIVNENGLQAALAGQSTVLFYKKNFEEALLLRQKQEEICRRNNYFTGLVESLINQAIILKSLEKLSEAKSKGQEALDIALTNNLSVRFIKIIKEEILKL